MTITFCHLPNWLFHPWCARHTGFNDSSTWGGRVKSGNGLGGGAGGPTLWSYKEPCDIEILFLPILYLFLNLSLSSVFLLLKETINVDWCELVWMPRLPLYIKRYISPCFPPMPRHLLSVSVAIFVVKPFLVCDFVDIWNKHGAKLANYILNLDYTNIHA